MKLIEIAALLIFLFPLAFSPGPGNMFFAASGAKFGFKKTLSANFGYHLAYYSHFINRSWLWIFFFIY